MHDVHATHLPLSHSASLRALATIGGMWKRSRFICPRSGPVAERCCELQDHAPPRLSFCPMAMWCFGIIQTHHQASALRNFGSFFLRTIKLSKSQIIRYWLFHGPHHHEIKEHQNRRRWQVNTNRKDPEQSLKTFWVSVSAKTPEAGGKTVMRVWYWHRWSQVTVKTSGGVVKNTKKKWKKNSNYSSVDTARAVFSWLEYCTGHGLNYNEQ